MNPADEPQAAGAVIRVHNPNGKYPEHWVKSYINGGAWYPDQETFLTGVGVRGFLADHKDYPDYWDVAARGRVELLTIGDRGSYVEGWRAGVRAVGQACDDLEYGWPDAEPDATTAPAAEPGSRSIEDAIDAWQSGDGKDMPLHDYLGMTREQFARWVKNGQLPDDSPFRKAGT